MGAMASQKQPHDCLLNSLFGRKSKETSKFRVTGLCAGKSPETGEFPAQMASNAENASIWWRHHGSFPPGVPDWLWIGNHHIIIGAVPFLSWWVTASSVISSTPTIALCSMLPCELEPSFAFRMTLKKEILTLNDASHTCLLDISAK